MAEIAAAGQDVRGKGGADMRMTSRIIERGPSETEVTVTSTVNVTGILAQFGRGMIQDLSDQMFRQFTDAMRAALESAGDEAGAVADAARRPARILTPRPATALIAPRPLASAATKRPPGGVDACLGSRRSRRRCSRRLLRSTAVSLVAQVGWRALCRLVYSARLSGWPIVHVAAILWHEGGLKERPNDSVGIRLPRTGHA